MSVIVNSSGKYPMDKKFNIFALFRMAVDDDGRLYDHAYLGPKICISGDDVEEVRAKIHEIVNKLFDGFTQKSPKVVIETQEKV
jgi:hypothetical protein